jgi:hypothetical protein
MPSIRHLHRLRRCFVRGFGVETGPVAADIFVPGCARSHCAMLSALRSSTDRRPCHIPDRKVSCRSGAPCATPIVDAQHPRRVSRRRDHHASQREMDHLTATPFGMPSRPLDGVLSSLHPGPGSESLNVLAHSRLSPTVALREAASNHLGSVPSSTYCSSSSLLIRSKRSFKLTARFGQSIVPPR